MPAVQLPLAAAPHRNQQLFSDYYLNTILPQRDEHRVHTNTIIQGETALNARVYALFGLSAAESALVEASTKYRYGEV